MTENAVRMTLIGGSTALLEIGAARLLTDPTFDEPGSYPSGTITLAKKGSPALAAEAFG